MAELTHHLLDTSLSGPLPVPNVIPSTGEQSSGITITIDA